MREKLRLAYFAHSFRSDWNNGNAHFLRGLMRAMVAMGHDVSLLEPASEWSIVNLQAEVNGIDSLTEFARTYPDLHVKTYASQQETDLLYEQVRELLRGMDIVILHEWNPAALVQLLLRLRDEVGFQLMFHDTHHRASSSPQQIALFGLERFDGILVFGEVLRTLYRERFGLTRVWTLHEAADVSVFHPRAVEERTSDVVWIGNWGDDERSAEIQEFLLQPAASLSGARRFVIYGVRYPPQGLHALAQAGVRYGGYLPNLQAPCIYGSSGLTVHIPRRQYSSAMPGIPTIRVFEALACGIPLVSAPWRDAEQLFREGDFLFVTDGEQMKNAIERLLRNPAQAQDQAARGLETILARHTCDHRAQELTHICQELLA